MITTAGKRFIKRYMAGQAGQIAGAISVGIGTQAATLNDSRLQFEYARVPIDLITYDFSLDRLVFKATLPDDLEGSIYEIGIWTSEFDSAAGNQASRLVTTFDSLTEDWEPGTYEIGARIGQDSLKHTPAANTSSTSVMSQVTLEFGENSNADEFVFAYNVQNGNVATIQFRFKTDDSNYYEFAVSTPTPGYKFTRLTKGSAAVVGVPAWDDINDIEVVTTATGVGAASVLYEAIRIEDLDTVNSEYGLINRYVLVSPEVKELGLTKDIEVYLQVSV